jgi:hypothetical protein
MAVTRTGLMAEDQGIYRPIGAKTDTTIGVILAAIGSSQGTVLLSPGTWVISNNLTFPSNTHLKRAAGALFSVNGSVTLTIDGSQEGPMEPWLTGAGTFALGAKIPVIYPEWFGAVGTADDREVIQRAINAAWVGTTNNTRARPVQLGARTYTIGSPLDLYSKIHLCGVNQYSSVLAAGIPFSGNALIRTAGIVTGGTFTTQCLHAWVTDLRLDGGGSTTIAAIRANTALVSTCQFRDLQIGTPYGLKLDTYTQSCIMKNIQSYNGPTPIQQLLHLKGNFNYMENLDKESNSGSSTDPIIFIERHGIGLGWSDGNTLRFTLIEQVGSANKTAIRLEGIGRFLLEDLWHEESISDGYMLRIIDARYVSIRGHIRFTPVSYGRIQVVDTQLVDLEQYDIDATESQLSESLEVTNSHVRIRGLRDRRGNSSYPITQTPLLTVEHHINRQLHTDATVGYMADNYVRYQHGHNMAINGSFEMGRYDWTFLAAPNVTEEYVPSNWAPGLAGHFVWTTAGTHRLTKPIQAIAFIPLTITALVHPVGTGAFANIWVSGLGIVGTAGYNRHYGTEGVGIITHTVVPTSTGSLIVGIDSTLTTELWVDEFTVQYGTHGALNPAKFGSFEVGPISIATASVMPTTGTWVAGSFVHNSAPVLNANQMVILGWKRLTSGSGHVSGTDWAICHVSHVSPAT